MRVAARSYPLAETIYVDSGSTDGSPQLARELDFRVVELTSESPSAAKARDAGWRVCRSPVVLFLDGDCRLDPHFLPAAAPVLERPEVAAVFGRIHEQSPDRNWLHHVMHLHWGSRPAGRAVSAPGCLAIKRRDIQAVGGYRSDLAAGEDADLSFRIVNSGRELVGLARPMVWHDVSMDDVRQYWTRFKRTGYSDAHLRETYGDQLKRAAARRKRILLRVAGAGASLASLASPWPWAAPLLAAAPVAPEAFQAQMYGGRWYSGLLFAGHLHLASVAMLFGRFRRARDRRLRSDSEFNYKRGPSPAATSSGTGRKRAA